MWFLLWCCWAVAGPVDTGDDAFADGDYPAALIAWGDALKQTRAQNDPDAEREILLKMSAAYRELGRVGLALNVINEASRLGKGPAKDAAIYLSYGRISMHTGDTRATLEAFRKSLAFYKEAKDPQGAANAALNLGAFSLQVGNVEDASHALDAARTIFIALKDPAGEADATANLALSHRRRGELRLAREQLDGVLALYKSIGDEAGQVDTLINLAAVEADLARPAAAQTHLEQALAAAQDRKDLAQQGSIHQLLGALAWQAGNAKRAAAHLESAVAAFTQTGRGAQARRVRLDLDAVQPLSTDQLNALLAEAKANRDPRLEAQVVLRLAQQGLRADPSTADDRAKQAYKSAIKLELPEVQWQALVVRGYVARDQNNDARAIELLTAAVDVLELRRRLLPADASTSFIADHDGVYQALADLHLRAGEPLKALATAERLALSTQPANAPKLTSMAQQEAAIQQAIGDEVVAKGETIRAMVLRDNLARLRVEFADTVDRLRTDVGDLDARIRVAPEDLEALQSELPEGVAVVQPIILQDRLVLLVFTRNSLRTVDVPVDAATLDKTVSKLTRALRAGLRDRAALDPLAQTLGGWLWTPIAGDLEGASTVVVSAAGSLKQLPFGLLRHNDRYLMQDAAVASISHVGSLRGAPQALRVEGPTLLLVGNPDGTLPGAEAEVRAISGAFRGSTVLVGERATREAVLEQLKGRTTLHLATHGRIDAVEPNRSYLVLAGDDAAGRLSYREIPGLAPYLSHARIVVLSACESGRPVQARGGDGVVSIQGLAAQFRRAGVETLVASLWKVDDEGTKALMQAFYAELAKGTDAATSMAMAQRSLLKSEAHNTPWVWAAFVVAGDWR
ncbi:MAG: CHAT domain-containing protein [Myxococcota bacterium]